MQILLRAVPLLYAGFALGCGGLTGLAAPVLPAGALSPQQALGSFELEPGLTLELAASEPTVADPVALAFDESGRLFVVENRGYPTGPGAGESPMGRIALLEDRDGDGLFESRSEFADGLTFPNGVMPWEGGLIVTCAPDVLFLKDTDGDGRADIRTVLLTGFSTSGSTQLRVSHPTFAIDNWIYLTSGLTGGKVTAPGVANGVEALVKGDSRFRAGGAEFEALDGRSQFGLAFDDYGRRFICMNRVHLQHVVLPSRYLSRNPYLAFSDTVQNVPESLIPEPLKGHGASAQIHPISSNVTTADSHAGTFTAACGILIYRGTALPGSHRGNAFACDPTGNLVHRDVVTPNGATFSSRPAREGSEFLASRDNWFRPVNLTTGPDGALYICDMYRKTIEHPEYLPEEVRKRTDFVSGRGLGRIYRVSEKARLGPGAKRPQLGDASAAALVEELENRNAWWRETAHRLLVQRQDRSVVPALKTLVRTNDGPAAAHALRILEALGGLDESTLRHALMNRNPGVREQGLVVFEQAIRKSGTVQLAAEAQRMADDPDARVRFQCALLLGEMRGVKSGPALARIAMLNPDDRWTRAAVLSSIPAEIEGFLHEWIAVLARQEAISPGMIEVTADLGRIAGAALPAERLGTVMLKWMEPGRLEWRLSGLNGFSEGLSGRPAGARTITLGELIRSSEAPDIEKAWTELLNEAGRVAIDSRAPAALRVQAVKAMSHARSQSSSELLVALLNPAESAPVQTTALRVLGTLGAAGTAAALLEGARWKQYTPDTREQVLNVLLSRPSFTPVLLEAVERGAIPLSAIGAARRRPLLEHKDSAIRAQSRRLFEAVESSDRMKVFAEYKSVLDLAADAAKGREVFRKHCAACHRLDREGVEVGPDLFGIRNQPMESILLHVLVPDFEIAPGFGGYVVETKDGRVLSGLIRSETASSITLRAAQGHDETIVRSAITSVQASGVSLMPQELEKAMSRPELADLLAFLKGK